MDSGILVLVAGKMSGTMPAVIGSCVSDLSEKRYDRNSISSLTDNGKLQMAGPTAPDLTATHSYVQGER